MLSKFNIYINRKHLCDVCGKSFGKKAILTEHIRTHTKEKPFICPYEGCSKAFSEKGNMTIHYKRHFKKQLKCQQHQQQQCKFVHSVDSTVNETNETVSEMSFNEMIRNYNMFDNDNGEESNNGYSYRNHCDELTTSLFVNIAKAMDTVGNNDGYNNYSNSNNNDDEFIFDDHNYVHLSQVK